MRTIFLFFILFFSTFVYADNPTIIPPVVISANKNPNHTITHASRTVITQQDMTAIGATSLSQALQELGGVQLQDTTGNGSQVMLSMRGFGANAVSNTLMLINGIPITNPDLMPPDLNVIPVQEVEYIEITAGTESVLYGDQAVGGTINIVTRKKSDSKLGLVCGTGSYNQYNCFASMNKNYKNLNINLGAYTNHTDNYRHRNGYNQNLLSGNLSYPYSTGETNFDYQIGFEQMQYPGALTAQQVRENRRQASSNANLFRDWNGLYHLKNLQQINNNWRIETDIARREMHGDGVLTSPFTQARTVHFIKPQLKGNIGKIVSISGIDFEDDHYHLNSLFGPLDDSLKKYGLFSLLNIPINSRFVISAGARGAQQNSNLFNVQETNSLNRAFASTLGASFQANNFTELYLRRAENFRFPKADENASTPFGTKGLKTQRGVSYETGANFDWRNSKTKLGIFILNLRDEIAFDPTQTVKQPFGANRNLPPTARQGFMLSENFPFTEYLTFDSQYNFVNARFQNGTFAGNRIPLVSENIFHGGMNYKFFSYWNLYSEVIYTGNQFAANDYANIAGKMGGYTVYNFNLRYQFKSFSAAFRVNNLFNKQYYFYTVYQPSMLTEFYYPAPERNFFLTLKYEFL